METAGEVNDKNRSETDAEKDRNSCESEGKEEDPEKLGVLSVDKVVLEKIVLEENGSRQVLLTKNETSRKLSIKSEPGGRIAGRRSRDERKESGSRFRVVYPEETFASRLSGGTRGNGGLSKLPLSRARRNNIFAASSVDRRIRPIKLTKTPLIGSIVVAGLKTASLNVARNRIPPRVPVKPNNKRKTISGSVDSSEENFSLNTSTKIVVENPAERLGDERERRLESPEKEEPAKQRREIDEPAEENQESTERSIEGDGPITGNIASSEDTRSFSKNHEDVKLDREAQDRLEKSHSNIEVLQKNLGTRINASTARTYKEKLLGLRDSCATKLSTDVDSSERIAFDKDFLEKHNLDKRLKIEENRLLETDLDYTSEAEQIDDFSAEVASRKRQTRPNYSKKVSEVEKRWSGEFLESRLENNSSESSRSSYVEEFGSVSSRESALEDGSLRFERSRPQEFEKERLPIDDPREGTSRENLEDSTVSTVDSDSCLEDRIKAVDEDIDDISDDLESDHRELIEERAPRRGLISEHLDRDNRKFDGAYFEETRRGINNNLEDKTSISSRCETLNSSIGSRRGAATKCALDSSLVDRSRAGRDGYASLIKEFSMEPDSPRVKKEEKQKKKLGLRRLLPGFFSPKDSRKDYKKKESKERKKHEERHFARYQQNGNYTRSPDTMNLNEDIKRNVKLDNSLNGSIIEERLDEIKRELFPDQVHPMTSTPDHMARADDRNLLRDHSVPPRSYTANSSLSSIAPDDRWNDRNAHHHHLAILPDSRKFVARQKEPDNRRYGQLERKHSLQESSHGANRSYFFQRNHGPSGRISAPPTERYLVRPRAIHPIDRPLPAIPHSRLELANYENYHLVDGEQRCVEVDSRNYKTYIPEKLDYSNHAGLYANDEASNMILKSVSAQVKITRQPIVNQNQRAPLLGRSPKYPSPGSSQKSGDYADSSCTPNSSQKSEFSPTSSKSGEYYLHSPPSTGSPIERAFEDVIYANEGRSSPSILSSTRCANDRIYDETSPSPSPSREIRSAKVSSQRSIEDSLDGERISYAPTNRNSVESRSTKNLSSRSRIDSESSTLREQEIQKIQTIQKIQKILEPQRQGETVNEEKAKQRLSSPSGSRGKTRTPTLPSSPGARGSLSSRRSQPNDQILIASPKREVSCEARSSRPSNESIGRHCGLESPVPMTNSPHRVPGIAPLEPRAQDPYGNQEFSSSKAVKSLGRGSCSNFSSDIPRPEPIYGHRGQQASRNLASPSKEAQVASCQEAGSRREQEDRVAWVQGRASSKSPEKRSGQRCAIEVNVDPGKSTRISESSEVATEEVQWQRENNFVRSRGPVVSRCTRDEERSPSSTASQEKIYVVSDYEQRQLQQLRLAEDSSSTYVLRSSEPLYAHRGASTSGPLSPTKRETRQHLEAFYWQQKALEAHRKTATPAVQGANLKKVGRKIDLPEVREAVYWQQLKKLDEEQQRRIYEQNSLTDDESSKGGGGGGGGGGPKVKMIASRQPVTSNLSISTACGDPSYWESKLHRATNVNPTGKPPLMQTQKGLNQPVLIVRPQQTTRERLLPSKGHEPRDVSIRQEARRSKSTSPRLHRMDPGVMIVARKTETSSICEEEANEIDGKPAPPPIFKRGSLIGGESVEYGTAGGPKRVSFSNQSCPGQDFVSGSWPTKRGNAPEPPTRRHRSEDSTSDTDSVFSHQDRRDASQSLETEYDADKPLPPLPKDPNTLARPAICDTRCGNSRRSTSTTCEDGTNTEETRRMHGPKEEEWNPDGKGRQSNDTGGSGRGEGDTGSNEIPTGRRGGGGSGGGGLGSGGGGGVLGVGVGSGSGSIVSGGRSSSGGGGRSRDEPRRHTLGGDHQPSLHHQQFNAAQQLHPLHPHHLPPPHGQYGTPPTRHTTMDLEMGTKSRQRKSPLPRGYPPPSSTMLFDDDPGIMSEVETSSTGFRRGGKQRSSLPVVRTPSKTLERPLGLVFLQYRNETKRALLPNEITSIDTVKALFVRSFPKQLTMEYLDSPHVKVYIHDSNKDMFYELEDFRSHLRDIRDRSVLRLFESTDGVTGMPGPLGVPGGGSGLPPHWEDQSYFSEPEFDSEYQHQHIHKSKTAKNSTSGSSGYYVGGSSTLPRGGPLLRAYSPATSSVVAGPNSTPTQPKTLSTPGGGGAPPAKPLRSYQCGKSPLGSLGGSARFSRDSSVSLYSIPDRLHGESGYMSSPERGGGVGSAAGRYPPGPYSAGSSYEDPYYSQYSGTVTPVIDEEASDTELLEESYSLYGVKPPGRPPSGPPRSPFPPGAPPPLPPGGQNYDSTRIRVEHMERQLANLTGLVQKALTHAPHPSPSPRDYLQVPAGRDPYARAAGAGDEFDKHSSSSSASLPDDSYLRTDVKPPKLGKDKSVSFEKSVSFSDEPPDMNSPKQHSPQHAADTKPTKPAIKSSTLPRMSSQERDRHKPTPPPKPAALVAGQYVYRDLALTPEMYNQLRGLQKKAKDLRQEVRNLRRMSQTQAHTVRETIRDTFLAIRTMLLSGDDAAWSAGDAEKIRLSREEDLYKQEMIRLEKDLTELEGTVEKLRGNVINRKTRVNMADVENMALILSKSSKTVADLKVRFPNLQEGMKGLLSSEMEKVVREEKFLKEEPERLESALRRCKKLTGTLVTLKRLASVQEQRLPNAASVDAEETPPITPTSAQHSKATAPVPAERTVVGSAGVLGGGGHPHESPAAHQQRPENALDALLDELQTFSRPSSQLGQISGMGGTVVHQAGSTTLLSELGRWGSREATGTTTPATTTTLTTTTAVRAPCISDIGRKGSVDSSSGILTSGVAALPSAQPAGGTLRRLHSYPSSSDTDTSPPIARLQVSLQEQPSLPVLPQGFLPGQKPPVPERNAELLQLASARRVPPPPPPRTSSRSPLASPTSPQLPPRNHSCNVQGGNATLRRPTGRGNVPGKEGKPPMALPPDATAIIPSLDPAVQNSSSSQSSAVLSTSNSSSCESVNSQEGMQSKRGRQEQLEQRHQELLRKQKALQEQYARLQQLQRNAAGLTTVPPAPPDLLKKTGSESNLLAKMGLGMSAASSGSLTSLTVKTALSQDSANENQEQTSLEENSVPAVVAPVASSAPCSMMTNSTVVAVTIAETNGQPSSGALMAAIVPPTSVVSVTTTAVNNVNNVASTTIIANATNVMNTSTTTTSKIYETDIL